jgi:hypothetical protein
MCFPSCRSGSACLSRSPLARKSSRRFIKLGGRQVCVQRTFAASIPSQCRQHILRHAPLHPGDGRDRGRRCNRQRVVVSALRPRGVTAHSTSKGAVIALTRAMAVDHGRRVRAHRSRHSLTGHGCTLVTRPAMLPGAKAGRQRAAACARCNRSKQLRIPPMQSGRWRQPNLDV